MVSEADSRGDDGIVMSDGVRVWVVDDHAGFRRATAATVRVTEGFTLAGQSETGESAVESLRDGDADLVLMDIHMPGIGGPEAAQRLRREHPGMLVVLVSTYEARDLPAALKDCGATYLAKNRLGPDALRQLWAR